MTSIEAGGQPKTSPKCHGSHHIASPSCPER
jgi:hypothetical protein